MSISTKTIARLAAIQALYQYESNERRATIQQLIADMHEYYQDSELLADYDLPESSKIKLHKNYFQELIEYSYNNLAIIDDIIAKHLTGDWTLEKLHITLLAVLRVAVAELIYFPEVPYKVIINEFTNFASDFAKETEVAFVNSLLDKVQSECRKTQI